MTKRSTWLAGVAAATAVGWAGFFIHNVADLPGQTILSPESLLPTLICMAALVLWLVPATRTAGAWALIVWAVLNLIGGAERAPTVVPTVRAGADRRALRIPRPVRRESATAHRAGIGGGCGAANSERSVTA